MLSCYAAALVNCTWPTSSCLYPRQCLHIHHLHLVIRPTYLSFPNNQTRSQNNSSIAHCHTDICNRKELEKYETDEDKSYLRLNHNHSIHSHFYSCTEINSTCNKDPENQSCLEREEKQGKGKKQLKKLRGHFLRMWWANLKAQLGQRINVEGIVSSVGVLVKEQHLVLPHVRVPNVTHIDWEELHRRGFKGVVFDKDNTITVPYSLALWAPLGRSMEQCKSVFGKDIAVFSNSAGLLEYDHDGRKARILENAIGIKVLRHRVKKPAGTADEIEEHFGCKSSKLIMVGDRPFTDIVYGNRNGFFTILTEPLSLDEEPFIVRQVRKLEVSLVNYWSRRGLKPTCHKLLPDAVLCIKDPLPS